MADPSDWHATTQIAHATGLEVYPVVASRSAILGRIDRVEASLGRAGGHGHPAAGHVRAARPPLVASQAA